MDALTKVENVSKDFSMKGGFLGRKKRLRALDGVSIEIARGETLAVVGESGCGKSTLARTALGLISPTSGRVLFDGVDLASLDPSAAREIRSRMQLVFQDPFSSLDPRMRIVDIIAEPLRAHGRARDVGERRATASSLLEMVGLGSDALDRFPHEFSGGQRQRICVARAIALKPDLVVCDEPLSALDVSVRSQVINLLTALKRELSLTYLLISHDLSVVRYMADRVAVMYLGRVVEAGSADEVFESPLHPYTRSLLDSAPISHPKFRGRARALIEGELPSPTEPQPGCAFRTRCPEAEQICATERPLDVGAAHSAACHHCKR